MVLLPVVQTLLYAVATLVGAVALACVVVWQRRLRTDAPGLQPLPVLGSAHLILNPADLTATLKSCYETFGSTFRAYIGPKLIICVTRPEDLERILMNGTITDRDHYMTKVIISIIGDGLLSSTGSKWKSHRKVIAPFFSGKVLQNGLEVFNREACSLADSLDQSCGQSVSISTRIASSALEMISQFAFGSSVTKYGFSRQEITESVFRGLHLIEELTARPWLVYLEPLFRWSTIIRDRQKLRSILKAFFTTFMAQKTAEIEGKQAEPNGTTPDSESGGGAKKPKMGAFLEHLLISADSLQLNEEDICSEMATIVSTGFDTTANTTCFALTLLSLHPKWQRAVHQELDDVFGSGGDDYHRPVTSADLPELNVLDRVIKETMRLFPAAPILPRYIPHDMCIGAEGYKAPAGCCVICVSYFTHRDPENFPLPDKFDPDRFLTEKCQGRHPYSYIPFGAGARNCIGGRFAIMQIKIVLSTLLRRFSVFPGSTREELEDVQFSVGLKPAQGLRVVLERRTLL